MAVLVEVSLSTTTATPRDSGAKTRSAQEAGELPPFPVVWISTIGVTGRSAWGLVQGSGVSTNTPKTPDLLADRVSASSLSAIAVSIGMTGISAGMYRASRKAWLQKNRLEAASYAFVAVSMACIALALVIAVIVSETN